MNFKELLDQAASEVVPESEHEHDTETHWSRKALEEFAAWLNERYGNAVFADLSDLELSDVTRLRWSPVTRPNEATSLIVASGQGARAIIFGTNQRLFSGAEEFERYLAALVKTPEFRHSVENLSSRNKEPVEAYLRSSQHPHDRDPKYDVFVAVSADDQKKIAHAYREKNIEHRIEGIKVKALTPGTIAQGLLAKQISSVKWLITGGIVLGLENASLIDDNSAMLTGTITLES